MAKISTPPNMVEDQFMFGAVTGVASGQKEKNHSGIKKMMEMMFRGMPSLPRDHLRGGSASPRNRLASTHPMVMMYEVRMETLPHELMALRAVDEPRLMQARREVTMTEMKTA